MVSARLAIEVHLNVHENALGERAKCRSCLNPSGWGLRVSVSNKPPGGAGAYAAGTSPMDQTWGSKTRAYLILMCPHSPLSHGTETLVVSILF